MWRVSCAATSPPPTSAIPPPAASPSLEILAAWPGVHALLAHRVAHVLHDAGVPVAPRAIAATARTVTGIEIHPAADVGDGLFIDHGMGVVVGETAEIGENVTLYQGVTLGGTGFATGKRHPTVEDNVTIGSGAKLLGPIRIGHGAKIGANAVVVHDVPPNFDRGRQPRPHRARRGPQARGSRRRLGAPPRPDRGRAEGALEADRRSSSASSTRLRGEPGEPRGDVLPLRPVRGPNPAGG